MSELTAYIPAGGFGSRMLPHTLDTPKPLLLMGSADGRIIDDPIAAASEACGQTWVAAGYLGGRTEEYLAGAPGVTTLRDTGSLGIAGSLMVHYAEISGADSQGDMLILPGDHVYEDFSVAQLWERHVETEADITLLTVPAKPYGDYVLTSETSALSVENICVPGAVSTTGIFIFRNRYLMDRLLRHRTGAGSPKQCSIYRDIVCPAVGSATVSNFFMDEASGFWDDAGIPSRYLAANMRRSGGGQNVIASTAAIGRSADLERCVVLDGVTLEEEAVIKNAIISSRCGKLAITEIPVK